MAWLLCDDKYCGFKLMGRMGESDRQKHLINDLISEDSLLGCPRARHFISDYRSSVKTKRRTGLQLDISWVCGRNCSLHAAEELK